MPATLPPTSSWLLAFTDTAVAVVELTTVWPPMVTVAVPSALMVACAPARSDRLISRVSRWSSSWLSAAPVAVPTAIALFSWASWPVAVLIWVTVALAWSFSDWLSRPSAALASFRVPATALAFCSTTLRAALSPGLLATAAQEFQKSLSCSARPLLLGSSNRSSTLDRVLAEVCR